MVFNPKKRFSPRTKSYLRYILVQKEGAVVKLDSFFALIVQRESAKQKGSINDKTNNFDLVI